MNNQNTARKPQRRQYAAADFLLVFLTIGTVIYLIFFAHKKPDDSVTVDTEMPPMTPAVSDVTSTALTTELTQIFQTTTTTAQTIWEPEVKREIFLTFDDGPCENTPQVLDILDQYGAKATFFTVGFYVNRYPEYAAEIVKRGNLIGCHSYTHEFDECYASADAFMAEIEQWKTAVTNACGALPERLCVRFPGGSTTRYAKNCVDEIQHRLIAGNYRWFDWNAADNDKWPKGNTDNLPEQEYFMQSYRTTMKWFDKSPDTPVVFLMHDTESGSVAILPTILQDLIDRGYEFRTLDQHPEWG